MSSRLVLQTVILVGVFALVYLLFFLLPPTVALSEIESYLSLHTSMETFSVVVSCMIFGIIWNTCDAGRSRNVILLGSAFLAVGLLDFAHLMSYKGMPDFVTPSGAQKGIVFWLSARFAAAVAMLTAAAISWRPLTTITGRRRLLAAFLVFTALIYWLELRHPHWLPLFWKDDLGLTPLKLISEYVLIAMYAVAALLFFRLSGRSDGDFDCRGLCLASSIMALSELCFTSYASVTDAFNLLGHIYKVVAYLFLYQALFIQLVRDPYSKLERSRHEIWLEKERAEVTLQSIMDGVIVTDAAGNIVSMNTVAWQMTGWSLETAKGQPLSTVFSVFDETDRSPLENPVEKCLRDKQAVLLSNHAMIVSAYGVAHAIEQLASPIVNKHGNIIGVVMVFRDVGERRATEDKLHSRERRLSEAQAIAHLGHWEWDIPSGRIDWSDELYRIFGFEPHGIEPDYQTFLALLHPDDRYGVIAAIEQAIGGGRPYDVEYRVVHRDGTIRHAHALGEVQRDSVGKALKMVGTVLDITERKQAEQLLLSSKAEIEDLYDHAPCGYHSLDGEGVFLRINQTELDWLGYSREELVGKRRFTELLAAESVNSFRDNYPNFKRDGVVRDLEYEMQRKDGSRFFVSLSATAIYDDDGRYLSSRSMMTDISERKRAEYELKMREAEQRRQADIQSAILDALPANLALIDNEGIVIAVNRRWRDFAEDNGLPHDKVGVGAHYLQSANGLGAQDDEGMHATFEGLRKVLSGDCAQFVTEYPCHSPDRQRWFRMLVVPLSTSERHGAVVMHLDITESWQHKNEIEALNQQLEQRVAERTSQLESANKELEAFSYSVSHDLRAPLRVIDGFAQILAADYGEAMPEDARRHLDRILYATKRMGELIDDLLQLARVSRGDLRLSTVDLSRIAEEVLTDLQHREPERQTAFKIAPTLQLRGDAHLLKIVLENLLANAWKFTRNRAVSEIEFGALQDGKETVYFVRDNGVGFNPKYAHKLFGAFQRLHSEDEFEGTGIGLATVQRIISRHGGSVWADSQPGEGAVFFFKI